jgi:hypothetical protein
MEAMQADGRAMAERMEAVAELNRSVSLWLDRRCCTVFLVMCAFLHRAPHGVTQKPGA